MRVIHLNTLAIAGSVYTSMQHHKRGRVCAPCPPPPFLQSKTAFCQSMAHSSPHQYPPITLNSWGEIQYIIQPSHDETTCMGKK